MNSLRARSERSERRRQQGGALLLGFVTLAAVLVVHEDASMAQGPAPTPSRDAGVGESTYGCVESVPKGAQRPVVVDTFPDRGTSGWAAMLSVTVRHGKGERVLPSGLDLASAVEAKKLLKEAGFSIPDQDGGAAARIWTEPEDAQKAEATTHVELPVVLLPPEPGRNGMVLPPMPVAIARANGEIATVCTRAHRIVVDDPIANTPDAMPKENPDGLPQREEWTALKRALGWSALGVLVGGLLAILLWKKLTAPKPAPPPPPPRPPWEVALEELDDVRHAGLLDLERYGEYFDRTSDALRRYLGARFGFDGLESTTDEILAAITKQAGGFIRFDSATLPSNFPAPGVPFESVARFLRECDLVKFANLVPTPDQCTATIAAGEAIVRGTMPSAQGHVSLAHDPTGIDLATGSFGSAAAEAPASAAPPKRVRSPYEPPDPDEPANAAEPVNAAEPDAQSKPDEPSPPEGASS